MQAAQHDVIEQRRRVIPDVVQITETPNGQPAGQHFIQHDPKREDVRAFVDGPRIPALLGRHVIHRAHRDLRLGEGTAAGLLLGDVGDAEVRDLHRPALARDQHVGRLDVAVNDPAGVRMLDRPGHLDRDADRLIHRELPGANQLIEPVAFHELHHDEVAAVGLPAIDDLDDVGVAQLGDGDRFTFKPGQ